MARIRKSSKHRAISARTRARLRVVAREQIATSMRIEGRSFPSVEAEHEQDRPAGTRTSA